MFSSASSRLLLRRLPSPLLSQAAAASKMSRGKVTHSSGALIAKHTRFLSTAASPPPPTQTMANANSPPPEKIAPEAGLGAQDAMKLFIQHGVGRRKLNEIAAEKGTTPLVDRWQKMVATYIETQCHVITLLGYTPDERGIGLYTQHLQQALASASPEVQDMLRIAGRDTYRMVLANAFDLPLMEEQESKGEMSIVDARNVMHKVSLRMQAPEVLEKVAKICSTSVAMTDSPEAQQIDMARKHTVIQQVMVDDVYLSGGSSSLVSECGFGEGEDGYVKLQFQLAEHQGDPLISQYVGAAMMKLMESAGIDLAALQQQAQAQGQA
mmetsp:Transcript_14100/g.21180  ORF Transcript_14100/g.21180 Transcript_14100/m.21180 type:complete len:324 (+) Transcript_14100:85-1056(+)